MLDEQETKLSPETYLEGNSMADFRCRQCSTNLSVNHSGATVAVWGLAQCNGCKSWTPFKEENGIFVIVEPLMPARLCPNCKTKTAFRRLWDWPPNGEPVSALDLCLACGLVAYFKSDRLGQTVIDQYPKVVQVAQPELPDQVKKAYAEALISQGAGAPNGALLMCRRAIQEALDNLGAKKGDLPTQLGDLVSKLKLTPDLKEWGDHARIGGKLAGHGTGGNEWGDATKIWGDASDAEAVIAFCEAFFEYVYVLPERNKERRAKTGTPPALQSGPGSNVP